MCGQFESTHQLNNKITTVFEDFCRLSGEKTAINAGSFFLEVTHEDLADVKFHSGALAKQTLIAANQFYQAAAYRPHPSNPTFNCFP
jgi:hypothetical protein